MLAVTRREKIKEIVLESKNVTVTELSKKFNVTDETIRRDLKSLADKNILIRTYGGAYINEGVMSEINVDVREELYVEVKERLARKSCGFINQGDSIFLDCSTTSLRIALTAAEMNVTILTNSHKIANAVSLCRQAKLILIGGVYDRNSQSFLGRSATSALSGYYVDKAFFSCHTASIENGLTDSNEMQAELRSVAISRSKTPFLVIDHTKLNSTSFARICGFEGIDAIITDAVLDDIWRTFLNEKSVRIIDGV